MTGRHLWTRLALAALLPLSGCSDGADVWIEGRVLAREARGTADDGAPATPPASYREGSGELWARDSLTTAYSDPPRAGLLAGGVAAEPADTALAGGEPAYAVARSESRVVVPLDVRTGGRVELEVLLELRDVELANSGIPRVSVSGEIAHDDGRPLVGGDLGTLLLEIHPDGSVILDELGEDPAMLEPNGSFARVLRGPAGGVRLDAGRYRVDLRLALEASAPARSGPHQLARIGQARATLRTVD